MPTLPHLTLETDSVDYHILFDAAWDSLNVPGPSLEIGVRRGGSSELIMLASFIRGIPRLHLAVDPWDDPNDHYNTAMGRRTKADLARLALQYTQDLCVLPLYSHEFFAAFPHGFPRQPSTYSLVFFDGDHSPATVAQEMAFFAARTTPGGSWVFDDALPGDLPMPAGFMLVPTLSTDPSRGAARQSLKSWYRYLPDELKVTCTPS